MPRLATHKANLRIPYRNNMFIKTISNKSLQSDRHTLKKGQCRKKK